MSTLTRLTVAAALLLASLAAAGCLDRAPVKTFPPPLTDTEDESEGTSGNWTYTVTPANLTGRPGDVRNFTVAVAPAANATPGPGHLVPPMWTQVQGNTSEARMNLSVPPGGRVFVLEVVLGAGATTNLTLKDAATGNETHIPGPAVTLTGTRFPVTDVASSSGNTTRPGGLQAERTATGVRATYTLGEANATCNLAHNPQGRFLLLQEGAATVLVGFLDYDVTDACFAGASERDWLTANATAPATTGPIDRVVLYTANRGCFCYPVHRGVSWERLEAQVP